MLVFTWACIGLFIGGLIIDVTQRCCRSLEQYERVAFIELLISFGILLICILLATIF